MRALEELKTTMGELLVALGNIVRACFRWFTRTPFCSLCHGNLSLSKFSLNFLFCIYFSDNSNVDRISKLNMQFDCTLTNAFGIFYLFHFIFWVEFNIL
jgi:hypothetical protein